MLYLAMAIQAIDLFLADVFVVKRADIRILFCPIHMAEEAFVLGRKTVAFCDLHVALAAFVTDLQSRLMREGSSPVSNGLRWH